MARLMILLVVVAVSLSAALACPADEAALKQEMDTCISAMASAGQSMAVQCLAINDMLKCMDTALTGCEGVAYVEARRAEIDAGIQSMKSMLQSYC